MPGTEDEQKPFPYSIVYMTASMTMELWTKRPHIEPNSYLLGFHERRKLGTGGGVFLFTSYRHIVQRPNEQIRNAETVPVHLAIVQDAENKAYRFYVDGKLKGQQELQIPRNPSEDELQICGAKRQWNSDGGHSGYLGWIDEVRISSIPRYDKNFIPARRYEADKHTLALYHFDEGKGKVLKDSSGNGHNGKITGAEWVRLGGKQTVDGPGAFGSAGSPPLAVAPFDEKKAKAHQQAWSDYLGLSVEKEVKLAGSAKMNFRLIPPGEFMMGSTDEQIAEVLKSSDISQVVKDRIQADESPAHKVVITKPFYLGATEVTSIARSSRVSQTCIP